VFGLFRKADAARGRLVLLASATLTLASMLSLGIYSYRNLSATHEANRLEKHTYLVILELKELLSAVKDAESGQRGYLITGYRQYLEPYQHAVTAVQQHVTKLRRLTRDNPDQQKRLDGIEPVLRDKLALMQQSIRVRGAQGFEKARELMMTDAGRSAMGTLRRHIEGAVAEEQRLLRERSRSEQAYTRRNFSLVLQANLIGTALLGILYLFLWREFSRRIRNERELLASSELLAAQNRELRRAGDRRQEMEAQLGKYGDLYDLAPVGYLNLDPKGVIRAVNLTGASFLGSARELLLERNLEQYLSPDSREEFHAFLARLFQRRGIRSSCEVVFLRPEAEPVHIQVDGVASDSREECRAVLVDISQLKKSQEERRQLENQLNQAQRMESVGRLAGGVAHDFNNMLSVILGQANLALMDLDPSHPLYQTLEEIRKAAERSADLTRQLLAFARRQAVAPQVLDLNQTVSGMLSMLQHIIGEDVRLEWQPGSDLWSVLIDPSQVDQIIANLCSNSRDSLREKGCISIATRNTSIDEEYCAHNVGFLPGEYVQLSVSDNGSGIERSVLPHIFEPFFTTKEFGKGTGLGLATVFGAVKQNNGFINVYSEPGLGTTFNLYFPRHREHPEPQRVTAAAQPPRIGQETLLLVEDEAAVLAMASTILTRQGYTVLAANTPQQALSLAREHADHLALLITDVVMPQMSGRELADQLVRHCPSLKLLFMSGYTSDIIAHHGVIDEGVHFIQKPFTSADLTAKVRQVLDSD
jgi:PAS domain S-box-containing protein